jgi:hypothetical protein
MLESGFAQASFSGLLLLFILRGLRKKIPNNSCQPQICQEYMHMKHYRVKPHSTRC